MVRFTPAVHSSGRGHFWGRVHQAKTMGVCNGDVLLARALQAGQAKHALIPLSRFSGSLASALARGGLFHANQLHPATRTAIEAGVAAAARNLRAKALAQSSSKGFFGTREELGSDYLTCRSMGAMLGVYGNSSAEALYASQQTGPDGQVRDGRRKWVLRFPAGPFFFVARLYGPGATALSGQWQLPALQERP